jgi:hypothetical protein
MQFGITTLKARKTPFSEITCSQALLEPQEISFFKKAGFSAAAFSQLKAQTNAIRQYMVFMLCCIANTYMMPRAYLRIIPSERYRNSRLKTGCLGAHSAYPLTAASFRT